MGKMLKLPLNKYGQAIKAMKYTYHILLQQMILFILVL